MPDREPTLDEIERKLRAAGDWTQENPTLDRRAYLIDVEYLCTRVREAESERDLLDRNWRILEAINWRNVQRADAAEARVTALEACLDQIEDESGAWGDMTGTETEMVRRLRAAFGAERVDRGLPRLGNPEGTET